MTRLLTKTSASALYMIAAFTAVTIGVLGGAFSLTESYATVQVIPLRSAIGAIVTGIGFLLVFKRVNIASVVFGVCFIVIASSLLISRLLLDPSFTITLTTGLMLLINLHFLLLGLCFCLPFNKNPGKHLWKFTGQFSVFLALLLFIYTWLPNTSDLTLPVPVSFVAICTLVGLTGVMLLTRYYWHDEHFEVDKFILLPASLITIITIVIWLTLSLSAAHDINQRGNQLTEQASQRINDILLGHLRAAQRMTQRWQVAGNLSESEIEEDAQAFLNDHPGVSSVMMMDKNQMYFQVNTESSMVRGWLQDPRLFLADSQWLGAPESGFKVQIPSYTVDRNQPSLLISIPVSRDSAEHLNLIFVLNIFQVLDYQLVQVFEHFTVYFSTESGLVIPSVSGMPLYRSVEKFRTENPFLYQRETNMLNEYPRTIFVTLKNTEILWASARLNQFVLYLGGFISLLLVIIGDSNKQLRREKEKLNTLANYDSITGLKRRDALEITITEGLAKVDDIVPANAWVLFVDLDGFKPVNDALGINAGNQILSEVGQRIKTLESKHLQLARFSSDEFIVFASQIDEAGVRILAKDILQLIRTRFDMNGVTISLTASIGVARLSKSYDTAAEVVQTADVAMTEAKSTGGNTYRFYDPEMSAKYDNALRLRGEIQEAIEKKEFEVYYQPIVDSTSEKIVGAEALARWKRPNGVSISPAEFIPVAEQTGQIFELSELIIRQAFKDLKDIQDNSDIFISINISGALLQRGKLLEYVDQMLDEYEVDPQRIHFEVTEAIFVGDKAVVRNKLHSLRDRGLKISIDDFGTGYSSLSMLYQLPVDIIKIDRSFIAELNPGSERYKVVCTIMELAAELKKGVIVEGVETEDQLTFSREKSCTAIQGFYFFRPMPFADLRKALNI